jgi:hypothetical protein
MFTAFGSSMLLKQILISRKKNDYFNLLSCGKVKVGNKILRYRIFKLSAKMHWAAAALNFNEAVNISLSSVSTEP